MERNTTVACCQPSFWVCCFHFVLNYMLSSLAPAHTHHQELLFLLGFKAAKSRETLNQNPFPSTSYNDLTQKKDSSHTQHRFGHAMVTIEVLLHKPVPQLFYVFCLKFSFFKLPIFRLYRKTRLTLKVSNCIHFFSFTVKPH